MSKTPAKGLKGGAGKAALTSKPSRSAPSTDKTVAMSKSMTEGTNSAKSLKHSYSNGPIGSVCTADGSSPAHFLLPEGAAYYIMPAPNVIQGSTKDKPTITMSELKLTGPAPNFRGTAVVDSDFKEISLADYRGKYLIFFFYPLDFTFVCPTEIIAFSDRVEEFRSINCEVVACSTDSHFSHLAWINTPRKQGGLGRMDIPLLADKNCDIAQRYGVYKDDEGIAFRGLFIIDDKGNLRQITINDLPVGRSVDETLRLVQAFQFTDKHGEVCPAGWKPGKETMKPNPTESKNFFQKNM